MITNDTSQWLIEKKLDRKRPPFALHCFMEKLLDLEQKTKKMGAIIPTVLTVTKCQANWPRESGVIHCDSSAEKSDSFDRNRYVKHNCF